MSPELAAEIDQTRLIFASVNHPFPDIPGASDEAIRRVTDVTGLHVSDDMIALWRLMDGSNQEKVFVVESDCSVPLNFLSTERVIEFWELSRDPDIEPELEEQDPPLDPRIRYPMWTHPRWLPIAEYNEGGTTVYYDTDPGPGGDEGQIIVYQHDPDAMYYVAPDIVAFVQQSNQLLRGNAQEYVVEFSGV